MSDVEHSLLLAFDTDDDRCTACLCCAYPCGLCRRSPRRPPVTLIACPNCDALRSIYTPVHPNKLYVKVECSQCGASFRLQDWVNPRDSLNACLICGQDAKNCTCKYGAAIRRIAMFGHDPLARDEP